MNGLWNPPATACGFVTALEAHDEQAIAAVDLRRLVHMVRVHHDERFVECAHCLRICDWQAAFKPPLSGSQILAICANGLRVSPGIVKQDHSPTAYRVIPYNAWVAADAPVSPLPFEHHAMPRPGLRDLEPWFLVLRRFLGNRLGSNRIIAERAG